MGIFLELSPPKKLRYTWHWEGSEEATEVSVEFGKEHGETRIQLEHQGFSNSEELNAHAQGWDAYIRGVEALINETGF